MCPRFLKLGRRGFPAFSNTLVYWTTVYKKKKTVMQTPLPIIIIYDVLFGKKTLTLPLSTWTVKMSTCELLGQPGGMLGSTLPWTNIPSRKNSNTLKRFMIQKPELNINSYTSCLDLLKILYNNYFLPRRQWSSLHEQDWHHSLLQSGTWCICPLSQRMEKWEFLWDRLLEFLQAYHPE